MTTRLSYGTKEAAAVCGVGVDTIRRAIGRGDLKARKSSVNEDGDPTGNLIILASDLQAWVEGLPAA